MMEIVMVFFLSIGIIIFGTVVIILNNIDEFIKMLEKKDKR